MRRLGDDGEEREGSGCDGGGELEPEGSSWGSNRISLSRWKFCSESPVRWITLDVSDCSMIILKRIHQNASSFSYQSGDGYEDNATLDCIRLSAMACHHSNKRDELVLASDWANIIFGMKSLSQLRFSTLVHTVPVGCGFRFHLQRNATFAGCLATASTSQTRGCP